LIRFLSLLSVVCLIGTVILVSTHNTGANIAGVFLIFIGAALMLFLMGRAAFLRVRETTREVEGAVTNMREIRKELLEPEPED
jgi:hypothetical protein